MVIGCGIWLGLNNFMFNWPAPPTDAEIADFFNGNFSEWFRLEILPVVTRDGQRFTFNPKS